MWNDGLNWSTASELDMSSRSRPLAARASVAVLPFADLDDASRREGAGVWLADDVIHHLSRFRHITVVGRRSAFRAGVVHGSLRDVGRSLGTRYLAVGTVRRTAACIEIEAKITSAPSGELLWCQLSRFEPDQTIEGDDDIAHTLATSLAVKIEALERDRLNREASDDAAAADGLILAADHLVKRFPRSSTERARELLNRALRIDPLSASAHAILARTYHLDWRYAWANDPDRALEQAVSLAQFAIELDPADARGYAELGLNRLHQGEHEAALAAYRQALSLNPNDPDILADFADLLTFKGEPEHAIDPLTLALRLKPEQADMYRYYLASAFNVMADHRSAVRIALAMDDRSESYRILAGSYAELGMMAQARHYAAKLMASLPNFTLDHWRKVVPFSDSDRRDIYLESLVRAGLR